MRELSTGSLPRASLESLSRKLAPHGIPWGFVDVIEVDPARRVKLRIEHERLAEMHPSDLAEILEDLAPAERDAVFTSLDEEVAAELRRVRFDTGDLASPIKLLRRPSICETGNADPETTMSRICSTEQ